MDHVYLRTGNLKVSVKLNRLKTFSTTTKKVTKHQYARLESEKKHVTQCLKKRLLYCQLTNADSVPHEQYLELPRALADSNGIPQIKWNTTKGTKEHFNIILPQQVW